VTTKEQILTAMAQLPDDATILDAMDRLVLLYKIQQGSEQVKAGKTLSQSEARKRLRKWLE
jgi:hypothetical protein